MTWGDVEAFFTVIVVIVGTYLLIGMVLYQIISNMEVKYGSGAHNPEVKG
ncbi:hypothetical protein ES703_70875 [subsurface metagenome]